MTSIKFSLVKDKVRIYADNKFSTVWIFFRNQLVSLSNSLVLNNDPDGSVSIDINDYLTVIESYEEGWRKKYDVKFVKSAQLDKIEKKNKIKYLI